MEGSLSHVSWARPGGHQLSREVVLQHQRQRILGAAVELIAERGYRSVSVADIVKRAATARRKFYENFSSKEDCFLAAIDAALDEGLRRMQRAAEGAEAFPDRVSAGIGGLVEFIAERPELARACVLEAPSLGAAAQERRERAQAALVELLRGGRDGGQGAELPANVEEATLGGLYWLIYHALLSGEPRQIRELRPEVVEFALTPFLGAEDARRIATR